MTERIVDATTPFGDAMWFRQMTGTEALSLPFEFDLIFHASDTTLSLPAKKILGESVTLHVETEKGGPPRFFNGICTRFATVGREGIHTLYSAKLRPWLWLASRRTDCKIFQRMKVPDIIKQVLGKYPYTLTNKLNHGKYREWEYCVQYQESDMDFVMRLMEHEGICFYFLHSEGSHAMVLVDDMSQHSTVPGKPDIIYVGPDAATVATEEHFNSWVVREEVDPGEYSARDYNFKKPNEDLTVRRAHKLGHSHDQYEKFEWPGGYVEYGEGRTYAGRNMEMLQSEQERCQGHTTVRTMGPGFRFNLKRCPRADQNREYLAVAVTYFFRDNARMSAGSGESDADWGITVTSQPTTMPYKPQKLTPKPRTYGPQTACVVGAAGEDIHTDEYGRIKVQFYWDRYGKGDSDSSCWLRVSTPWAGTQWGMVHIPRVGQEVIVDFIGGDPDLPIVTGSVYNATHMPPYALPSNKTQSGIKSRSSKGGGSEHFNEIRMEDKKGDELLYMHAEKDLETRVEHNEKRQVDNNRDTTVNVNDTRTVIGNDKHTITGNQTSAITGQHKLDVTASSTVNVIGGISVTTPRTTFSSPQYTQTSGTTTLTLGATTLMAAVTHTGVYTLTGALTVTGPVTFTGPVSIVGPLSVVGPIVGVTVTGTTTTTALANIV